MAVPSGVILHATSSQELRKREEGEKKARAARRRKTVKRKTKSSSKIAETKKETKAVKASTNTTETAKVPPKKKQALLQRLQRATANAKAAAIEADYANKKQQQQERTKWAGQPDRKDLSRGNSSISHHIGTLSQLTKAIDKELLAATDGTATFNVHGTTNPPPGVTRDSMRALLEENEAQRRKSRQQQHKLIVGVKGNLEESSSKLIRHIAIVISKPLVQDQVTLEYACRLRTLAKAIRVTDNTTNDTDINSNYDDDDADDDDESPANYRPSIICFMGETSKRNLISDADAGYIFFKHLCAANEIPLDGIDIMLEKTTLGKGALKHIIRHLRREYVPEWLKQSTERESALDEYGQRRSQPRKKVHLHFTFFSCDYDLCRLNDIHHRSPRQSILRPFLEDDDDDVEGNEQQSSSGSSQASSSDGIVEKSWSYRYCSYPYVHFKDSVTAFLGKCYLLAEELTPVLMNIRSVVDGSEFFQRDNYRVLVSIRRSFVTDMERFYQNQPSLKSTLRQYVSRNDYPLDIVLEGALLSLGRCLDLVRPAGLLIGYVPKNDWKTAEMVLEHAVSQLRDACDPDHPLDPADWGKLDQHYDQENDRESIDSSGKDLATLTNWRLEDDEE